ncbi:hypothetical protein [Vagococcus xieshaowenii]|uniref:Uncharacterized protein n=1 Tax=Vagococcus xieshaowenii TaxID=2562451 RepID=A0AAJ5EEU3_9ENTE|nr:hypothetical protein [Vagococcus xieshaowenii]QCA28723.1 hypothetical protein E4Z98_05105 [Vagococcus xieshaowenii]TFZ40469.1 hypothetical protein E4031_06670 [Vagococcus xieshaowenii]
MRNKQEIITLIMDIVKEYWVLVVFTLVLTIVLPVIYKKTKKILRKIKHQIIYHYTGIIVLAIMPMVQEFLYKQAIIKKIPTIGSINLVTLIMAALSINLTRIVAKQLNRRF